FSSRRRHTRFSRDWSSDVCSSDLVSNARSASVAVANSLTSYSVSAFPSARRYRRRSHTSSSTTITEILELGRAAPRRKLEVGPRSEERRVGKSGGRGWRPYLQE